MTAKASIRAFQWLMGFPPARERRKANILSLLYIEGNGLHGPEIPPHGAEVSMAVTTILVESNPAHIQDWTGYITQYDRETSKRQALDLVGGLGTPRVAASETLEAVLDLMGQTSGGGVALIYAHANSQGLIMRITANANSSQSKYLRGISRAWKAIDEIIPLRSGKWPVSGKPDFRIDVPKAVALFRTKLLVELRQLDPGRASRLADPATITNRAQADAWFDQWMDLMAKACLGGGLGEADLRRVCRAMQKVRDARFERVELRACNIGGQPENLNALKEFFGTGLVVAPKVTMFFGRMAVNPNPQGNLDQLASQLGGFRGNQFTPPGVPNHSLNIIQGGEAAVASGRRNRIFPDQGTVNAIMQLTEVSQDVFQGRLFSTTAAAVTQFLQAHYRVGHTFQAGSTHIPVGGMWTAAQGSGTPVPFVLPLETSYRDFLETST